MTPGQAAIKQITSMGLRVSYEDGAIKVGPKALVAPYREHVKEIIDADRQAVIDALISGDSLFMGFAFSEARKRGWTARRLPT
jgi:precorrin-6B methylase 1